MKLKSIPVMNLIQDDLELMSPDDFLKVEKMAEKIKQGFEELSEALPEVKYSRARAYFNNLSNDPATLFYSLLANKDWIPLNTKAVESVFSQVKN